MRGFLGVLLIVCVSGCGLFDEPAPRQGLACGQACGPCGLGAFECSTQSCDLGALSGAIDVDADCSDIVFGRAASNGTGTKEAPVGNLAEALEAASESGASMVLYSGDSEGPIELVNGVSVLGGWTADFLRQSGRTRVEAEFRDVEHGVCMNADGVSSPVVGNLECVATGDADVLVGGRVHNSPLIRFRNVLFSTGDGREGRSGAPGQSGEPGQGGEIGGASGERGRAGVNADCMMSEGGDGGAGGLSGDVTAAAETGFDAAMSAKGGPVGERGFNGQNGQDGQDGQLSLLDFEAGWVVVPLSSGGEDGRSASGGGGGGGGDAFSSGEGGGGGGGGAGGCGGTGGEPGEVGGSGVGLIVSNSTVEFSETTVTVGDAGDGGSGGVGGLGGEGGQGAIGGFGTGDGEPGGRGGNGGRGGAGGSGAPGAGGQAIGLVLCEANANKEELVITVGRGGNTPSGARTESQKLWECP